MFGDFGRQFGIDAFLQSFRQAQQQPPFMPGQVDSQGGLFGQPGEAPTGSLHAPGLGGAGGGAGGGGGRAGAAPTATPVAAGLPGGGAGTGGTSPLGPGGASALAPGTSPQPGQLPQTNIEQGAKDTFQRAGQPPGTPPAAPSQRGAFGDYWR